MVLITVQEQRAELVTGDGPVSCTECATIAAKQLWKCSGALLAELWDRCLRGPCGSCFDTAFGFLDCGYGTSCDGIVDWTLLGISLLAAFLWFVGARQDSLCGYGLLLLALCAAILWRLNREMRTRKSLEEVAASLKEENEALRESTTTLSGDLEMLKETIGAIGDKGDDWLGQLRLLYSAQKRENDRHSLLLRGHARIVLLQLIQHFDLDHSMRLNTTELRAAEAFLTAGFPDINIGALEEKAARGGVALADLEPLLLQHLETQSAIVQLEVQQPRAQAALLNA
mmetsp:Transcript_10743/g.27583  ORF Transcript_10743/g.27583 Transcript_10743/m.27583 type:complete len:285 (-) Transcript_10743:239-1093(-)